MTFSRLLVLFLSLLMPFLLGSCATVADGVASAAKEKLFGIQKRETLVSRVAKARDAQHRTKDQFASALEEFTALTGFHGGDLEQTYERLNAELKRSQARGAEVRERNNAVERVATNLFREWESEIGQIQSSSIRANSQRQLAASHSRYEALMRAMRRAEDRIAPVLATFKDHVLGLKHSLNAQAIDSLQGEVARVQSDVGALIREMERAIAEADAFIQSMGH